MTQYGSLPSPWYPGHPTGPTHRQQELTVPSASRKAALPAQSSHSAQSSGVGRTAAGAPVAPGVRGVARSPAPGAGASSVAWASAGARVGGSACGAGAQPSATRAASATARAEPRPSRRPRSGVLAPERPKIHRVVRGEDAAGRSILKHRDRAGARRTAGSRARDRPRGPRRFRATIDAPPHPARPRARAPRRPPRRLGGVRNQPPALRVRSRACHRSGRGRAVGGARGPARSRERPHLVTLGRTRPAGQSAVKAPADEGSTVRCDTAEIPAARLGLDRAGWIS